MSENRIFFFTSTVEEWGYIHFVNLFSTPGKRLRRPYAVQIIFISIKFRIDLSMSVCLSVCVMLVISISRPQNRSNLSLFVNTFTRSVNIVASWNWVLFEFFFLFIIIIIIIINQLSGKDCRHLWYFLTTLPLFLSFSLSLSLCFNFITN